MTTKVKITNDIDSNGDVILNGYTTCEGGIKNARLLPGDGRTIWITDSSLLSLTEQWPTQKISDGELLNRLGIDAKKWAEEFVKRNPTVDVGSAIGWFACAIETGRDAGRAPAAPEMPPVVPLDTRDAPDEPDESCDTQRGV